MLTYSCLLKVENINVGLIIVVVMYNVKLMSLRETCTCYKIIAVEYFKSPILFHEEPKHKE